MKKQKDNTQPIRKSRLTLLAFLLLLVGAGSIFYIWLKNEFASVRTKHAYVQGHIMKVTAPLEGVVATIAVHDFEQVKRGQVLFVFDQTHLQLEYDIARKEYEKLEARFDELVHEKKMNSALRIHHEHQIDNAEKKVQTFQQLLAAYLSLTHGSATQVDITKTRKDLAEAKEKFLRAKMESAELDKTIEMLTKKIEFAKYEMLQAQFQMQQQKHKLDSAVVRSPVLGHLGLIEVKPGKVVKAHDLLALLFYDENLWVTADFKESDLKWIKIGQKAKITLDSFPNISLDGVVKSFSPASIIKINQMPMPEQYGETLRVEQKFPVIVDIIEPHPLQRVIKPGMSAVVTIPLAEKH